MKKVLSQHQILTTQVNFHALFIDKLKSWGKSVQQNQKLEILAKFVFFHYVCLHFDMKTVLFQCQTLIIEITLQVLSIGNVKNGRKVVQ